MPIAAWRMVVRDAVCLFRFAAHVFYWVSAISTAGGLGHLRTWRRWMCHHREMGFLQTRKSETAWRLKDMERSSMDR